VSDAADVAVSIVDHQNRDLLRECLRSLPAACAGLKWHVTVTENVPEPATLELLSREFPEVAVLANAAPRGFGANHNRVIEPIVRERSARHVLVLNDDTVLAPGAVTTMVAALDREARLAAVGPAIRARGRLSTSRFRYPSARGAWRIDFGDPSEQPDPAGWLQGSCVLLRVAALAHAGAYDERFYLFFEDCDLSRRLEAAGWGLAVEPVAVVDHVGNATVLRPDLAPITLRQGLRSRHLYFDKWLGPGRARLISLVGRAILAGRAVARRLAGDRASARRLMSLARYDPRRPLPHEPHR